MRKLGGALVLALGVAMGAGAQAPAPPNAVGGTGRIQPAGGVLFLAGPPTQSVERVTVREGDHVKKGALLLALSEEPLRAAERELAQERLRGLEVQSAERRKMAELDIQVAELNLAQAKDEAAGLAGL